MYGGGGSACPCLRPLFGALAVGLLQIFSGPLSMLGLYWTVFIFIGSESPDKEFDTALYRANGQEFIENYQVPYSIQVLRGIFYTFSVPAFFPLVSAICVFISIIKKDLKFLQWSLITNLIFIASSVLVIILICSQGVKFLATLPTLAITMVHIYFLVVISLFKEWVLATNYYSGARRDPLSPIEEGVDSSSSSSSRKEATINSSSSHHNHHNNHNNSKKNKKSSAHRPPPPPIPPRGAAPRSIMAHSNGNCYNEPEEEFDRTRIVTVTSV